ncbi:MAG: hypothetical protein A2Z29_08055 [Chloroflexi bacterium RBG_16_56_11]|nr:MAG: hypothetical protein A2Z29_08055 [Chloroflexi bacterium RBG_16_56_11]
MKRLALVVSLSVLLAVIILAAGCTRILIGDEGLLTTREYDFTDFTRIEAGSAFTLDIIPSDNFTIAITAGENTFKHINVVKTGDTLKIGLKGVGWTFDIDSLEARITLPVLRGVELSGAAEGRAIGFNSPQDTEAGLSGASRLDMDMETGSFKSELSGASRISGRLVASSSDFDLSGASRVSLSGSGGNFKLDASGASRADMDTFTVGDADISLSGACRASLVINGKLNASLSGASQLRYSGSPTLGKLDISGGSELAPK